MATDRPTATTPTETACQIDTIIPTKIVRIDDVPYELRRRSGLSLRDYRRFEQLRIRLIEFSLQPPDALTPEDEQAYSDALALMCRIALPATDEVHARLDDGARREIVMAFLGLPTMTSPGLAPAARTETPASSPSTGTSSSPDSNGSTAATPAAG